MVEAGQLEPRISADPEDPLTYVGNLRERPQSRQL